jgi:hypothetical protein
VEFWTVKGRKISRLAFDQVPGSCKIELKRGLIPCRLRLPSLDECPSIHVGESRYTIRLGHSGHSENSTLMLVLFKFDLVHLVDAPDCHHTVLFYMATSTPLPHLPESVNRNTCISPWTYVEILVPVMHDETLCRAAWRC